MRITSFFGILFLFNVYLLGQEDIHKLPIEDLDKMNLGKVITKKRKTEDKVIVLAQGIVIGDSKTIFDVLMDCSKHKAFMPNFKACESYYEDVDSIYGKTVIDPPMTNKDYAFYLFTKFKYSDAYSKIAWKLDTSKVHPGPTKNTYGFWEIQKLEKNQYLLSFYSNSDFDFHWSINWLLEPLFQMFIKNGLPNLVKNVRARVESEQTWKIGDKMPVPRVVQKH